MRITIIGGPASGKSTVTDHLRRTDPTLQAFGVRRHFGELIRSGSPLGRRAEPYAKANAWIPDEIVIAAVREQIWTGMLGPRIIFEGMPGNRRQAELLDDLLDEAELPLDYAVHVATPPPICQARAAARLVCERCDQGSHQAVIRSGNRCARCGGPVNRRVTDAPDRFVHRLAQHAVHHDELLAHYRGRRLIEVDGAVDRASMLRQCDDLLLPLLDGAS